MTISSDHVHVCDSIRVHIHILKVGRWNKHGKIDPWTWIWTWTKRRSWAWTRIGKIDKTGKAIDTEMGTSQSYLVSTDNLKDVRQQTAFSAYVLLTGAKLLLKLTFPALAICNPAWITCWPEAAPALLWVLDTSSRLVTVPPTIAAWSFTKSRKGRYGMLWLRICL